MEKGSRQCFSLTAHLFDRTRSLVSGFPVFLLELMNAYHPPWEDHGPRRQLWHVRSRTALRVTLLEGFSHGHCFYARFEVILDRLEKFIVVVSFSLMNMNRGWNSSGLFSGTLTKLGPPRSHGWSHVFAQEPPHFFQFRIAVVGARAKSV